MSFALPQSFKTSPQEKAVGFFIIFAIAALIYLSSLKSDLTAFSKQVNLTTELSQSYGINVGSPVTLSGVTIGEITNIELLISGKVRVTISLPSKYQKLYRVDSTLKIDSQFGFDTLLVGKGVIFSPGKAKELLTNGANIVTIEPTTLSDFTDELNLVEISQKIGLVIDNFEKISANLANKETDINQILSNSNQLTNSLKQSSQQLPATLTNFNSFLANIDKKTTPIFSLLEQRLTESKELIMSSNQLMLELQQLSKKVQPSMTKLPETFEKMNHTLLEIELLTKQLQGLWYLGGEKNRPIAVSDEINIPYYNKESLQELLKLEPKGEAREQH
ncbi:MAG: MCE family protein [Colwellia sp.]|nr:MCE family protein [Colwellia sp.]